MNSSFKFTLLMLLAMFLWGGGWTALKILTESVGVEVLTFWRFAIMFISFIPIIFFLKEPLRLHKKSIKYILSSSVLNILFMVFSYLGVHSSTAGSGAMIITVLTPLITFILSVLILKYPHKKVQFFGLGIGLIGGFIMLNIQDFQAFINGGQFYFVFAAVSWAFTTLLAQKSNTYINPIHYSFFISFISMAALFILSIPYEISIVFKQDSKFWISLLYLGILGQSVATTIFFIASGRLGSVKASSFMFLVPFFALLIGYIVLDEKMHLHIIAGGVISLVAIYFINKESYGKKEKSN